MDFDQFLQRFEEIVEAMGHAVTDAEETAAKARALEADLAAASQHADAGGEVQSLLEQVKLLRAALEGRHDALAGPPEGWEALEPQPALFDAIDDGDIATVRAALDGHDINQRHGPWEATALYRAMSYMEGVSLEVVAALLDAGADPRKGLTDTNVLHGLGFGRLDEVEPAALAAIIRRCIDLGADIEARSSKLKWTPLITAASEWSPVAVEALLLAGADIDAKAGEVEGVFGAGADAEAFASGSPETMAVLKRFRAKG